MVVCAYVCVCVCVCVQCDVMCIMYGVVYNVLRCAVLCIMCDLACVSFDKVCRVLIIVWWLVLYQYILYVVCDNQRGMQYLVMHMVCCIAYGMLHLV